MHSFAQCNVCIPKFLKHCNLESLMISMSQETTTIRIKAYEIKALIRSKIKPINLDALKLSNQKIQYAQ